MWHFNQCIFKEISFKILKNRSQNHIRHLATQLIWMIKTNQFFQTFVVMKLFKINKFLKIAYF